MKLLVKKKNGKVHIREKSAESAKNLEAVHKNKVKTWEVVGCSVSHAIKWLNRLRDEGKIEGRQLATKAFLWRGKKG